MVIHGLLALSKDLAHQLWQVLEVLLSLVCSVVDLFVHVSHVSVKVVQFEEVLLNQTLFGLILVLGLQAKHLSGLSHTLVLFISAFLHLSLDLFHLLLDAESAHELVARRSTHEDDRFREVLLTERLLHELVAIQLKHRRTHA